MSNLFRKVVLFLLAVCTVTGGFSCAKPVPRTSGSLDQEVYVWQRSWSDEVREAVSSVSSEFTGFVVLWAEVSFHETGPRIINVDLNYETLREADVPVGIALRIGPFSGPFNDDDETASMLADVAAGLVEDAGESGISMKELQIDFDCADSKLDGYRTWLDAIRSSTGSIPITITALPSWLYRPEFRDLAESADGYVLQVHSLEPPTYVDDDFTLCDPARSLEWIELAAELGLPFKVALPTYGYIVAFDSEGEFIGLSAEGPVMSWSSDTQIRDVRSDPVELAGMVRSLIEDRPENLAGLVWYRLPVAGDRLNWPWETLSAVMEGREPEISFTAEAQNESPELIDIYFSNDGETDETPPVIITINWEGSRLLAFDVLRDFVVTSQGPGRIEIQGPDAGSRSGSLLQDRIRPGEKWMVGWLRFDRATVVEITVSSITH